MLDTSEFDNMIPLQKIRAVAVLKEAYAEQAKFEPIRKEYEKRGWYRIMDITNIRDIYQIVEVEKRSKDKVPETYYDIFVDFKPTHTCAPTFETALLAALACKHEGRNSQAAVYMAKMLGLKWE